MVAETFRLERFMWRVVLKIPEISMSQIKCTKSPVLSCYIPIGIFFKNNINMKIDAIFANTDPRFNICFYNISDRN